MNSLDSVRTLIVDHLKETSNNVSVLMTALLTLGARQDFLQKVYDAFFNLVADPTQFPDSIVDTIDIFTSSIDGFSNSMALQTVIAFACFEALARRRPEALNGPWETLGWMIVKYSTFANTEVGNGITSFKKTNLATIKFITELGSPELCQNPCLRLEIFRFMSCFNCGDLYYDRESYREKVIYTLFELYDDYTSFTIEQCPNFSPIDLQIVMVGNSINMGYIMNNRELEKNKSKIISSVLKLTRNLIILEMEKYQQFYIQSREYTVSYVGIENKLRACLSFCGLLSRDENFDEDACTLYLVQAISSEYLLKNYVIDTLDTLTQVSLNFQDTNNVEFIVNMLKNELLHKLLKGHVKRFPSFQYNQEINGGITPAEEYRLRYFQDIAPQVFGYVDSEYESECHVSEESDYTSSSSEGNDSEMDISD